MANWKEAIGAAAPAIATALGGPLAGVAVGALANFFGLSSSASEEDIANAVKGMNADQVIALRQIDADFKAKMQQANVDLERIASDDRLSARDMAKINGGSFQMTLTIVTAVIFIGSLVAIFLGQLEGLGPDTKTIINYAVGQISGWFSSAVIFYFGSTSGSREKDRTIESLSQY